MPEDLDKLMSDRIIEAAERFVEEAIEHEIIYGRVQPPAASDRITNALISDALYDRLSGCLNNTIGESISEHSLMPTVAEYEAVYGRVNPIETISKVKQKIKASSVRSIVITKKD